MSVLSERNLFRFIVVVFILGTLYRLYPVFAGQPALAQFFMTEDGYLMLTIARNMAIGLGMSVSEGTIPSNGVQPLATFLFAIPYYLTGGDKVTSLIGVHLIATAISVAGIFSVRALARLIIEPFDSRPIWPWVVAVVWYTGPLLLLHTMNGLETGLYMLMVTTTLVVFGNVLRKSEYAGFADHMLLGVACGVTFLARNDGAFLVCAIFLVWLLHGLFMRRDRLFNVVGRLIPPGLVSLLIAAPWLIFNQINFGSIVPVSGTAQALSGGFAKNAWLLPSKLFEHMFPVFPIPVRLESDVMLMGIALLAVAVVLIVFLIQVLRRGGVALGLVGAYFLFCLTLVGYYGFYFGAGWFLSRYLAPTAPFLITAAVCVALVLVAKIDRPSVATGLRALVMMVLVLSIGLLLRLWMPGTKDQGHFQVVDWVGQNVEPETWVGAVQTGTVGYWHDRTINLDGKVNPEALRILLSEGNVLNYVLESKIEYLADWHGIALWVTTGNHGNEVFSEAFEVLVHDTKRNLGVLKRKQ